MNEDKCFCKGVTYDGFKFPNHILSLWAGHDSKKQIWLFNNPNKCPKCGEKLNENENENE